MKIGYRSNISTATKMGMNLWSMGNRIYGPVTAATYDGNWQTNVYNLTLIISGENNSTFENSCDGPFKQLFIKPYNGGSGYTMNVGDYFDIQYIAFFKSLEEADSYEYSYGLSYVLGGGSGGPASVTVFSDSEITIGEEIPTKENSVFLGWADADDGVVDYQPGDTILIDKSTSLYAVWDTTHYVFEPDDLTASVGSGWTGVNKVEASAADTAYYRYYVDADATCADGSRTWLKFDTNDFPANFTLHDYPYMKVGYRSNITACSKMGMNLYSVHDRVYGPVAKTVYDEKWQSHVYDLSTISSGPSAECNFENCCDGVLKNLFFKPYYPNGITMSTGDWFDIQYIALFKTEEAANAFTFACTVTYDACGGTGAPSSELVSAGTYVINETAPTMENADFMGWATKAGGEVVYKPGDTVTLTGSLDLYAVWTVSHYVMDLDDYASYTGGGGLTATAHIAANGESSFVRYTVDGSVTASADGTRAHIVFDLDKFASDFSLVDYPIMKVGYRATASDKTRTTTLGMNYVTNYGRLWSVTGDNFKITHDGSWQTKIYDLSTAASGSSYGSYTSPTGSYNFTDCGDSPIIRFFFKPYRYEGSSLVKDDSFDIQYVAFFKTEEAANAYTYTIPEEDEIIYGDVDGNGAVETSDNVTLSRYLAKWSGYGDDVINIGASDVDNSGNIDSTDNVILSRYFANWTGYEVLPYAN